MLRCIWCTSLAIGAFDLPCCKQTICGRCYLLLDRTCPVCLLEPLKRTESGADWALRDRVKVFVDRKIAQLEIAQKSHDEGKNAPNIPSILSQNEASDARIADKGVKDEKIGPDPFGMGEDSWVGVQERKRLEAGALGAMGMSGFGKLPAELRVMIFECLGLTFAAAGDHSYGSSTGR